MDVICAKRKMAAAACLKGTRHHLYEDSYRLFPKDIPLVRDSGRGEIFAVFDGIGSAVKGKEAAQAMADILLEFYQAPESHEPSARGLYDLLQEGNRLINGWGFKQNSDIPLGGCAGTVAWIIDGTLHLFHAGDTAAVLIRDGKSKRLTREHQLENGAIFRYFGLGPTLEIETDDLPVEEFDRVLLVSDGVTKAFSLEEAVDVVERYDDIAVGAKALVQRSRTKGSHDDITALIIEIGEEEV